MDDPTIKIRVGDGGKRKETEPEGRMRDGRTWKAQGIFRVRSMTVRVFGVSTFFPH
jgi:hypothetical protein